MLTTARDLLYNYLSQREEVTSSELARFLMEHGYTIHYAYKIINEAKYRLWIKEVKREGRTVVYKSLIFKPRGGE